MNDRGGGIGDLGAGSEYHRGTVLKQEIVVALGNHTTADKHNVVAALFLEGFLECGYESLVTGGKRTDTNYVNVVVDGLSSHFLRCLEETANINVEA